MIFSDIYGGEGGGGREEGGFLDRIGMLWGIFDRNHAPLDISKKIMSMDVIIRKRLINV